MTLIETLIALLILGMLAAGIFSTFRLSQRSYDQVLRQSAATAEVTEAQRFLRRIIESAVPADSGTPGLQGTADALSVVAAGGQSLPRSGLLRYRIVVRSTAGARDLVVIWLPLTGQAHADTDGAGREEVLLRRIQSVQWSFAAAPAAQASGRPLRWQTQWGDQVMPPLVRLSVAFPPADRRYWPPFLAAPRVIEDPLCAFDLVAQRCRETAS